jgi:hypothetical protein
MASGTTIALVFAGIIAAGAIILSLYKAHEAGKTPASVSFERIETSASENQTVHALEFRAVHALPFLEDHLQTAIETGWSNETVRLRVESMRDSLHQMLGDTGDVFLVGWEGNVVRVAFTGVFP